MSNDAFALLTGGVKFDKKRFSRDMGMFHAQQQPAGGPATGLNQGISVFSGARALGQQQKQKQKQQQHRASVPAQAAQGPAASSSEEDDEAHHDSDEEDDEDDEDDEEEEWGDEASTDGEGVDGVDGNQRPPEAQEVDPGCPDVHTRDALEAANVVRKHYRIKVAGRDIAAPLRSWQEMVGVAAAAADGSGGSGRAAHASAAAARLVARLKQAGGWGQPSPIQRQAVPCLLQQRDLLAVAPTGSGKTLAFLVPLLLHLKAVARQEGKAGDGGPHGPRAVLLAPTNELAAQQARVLRVLLPGSGLRAGLLTKATAEGNTFRRSDVLLATPLRLATLAADGQVDLDQVRFLVLDEADKLFDMGFVQQIDAIVAGCTHKHITRALFSATLPDKVEAMARSVLTDPIRVTVGARNASAHSVQQRLLFVGREAGKLPALRQLLAQGLAPPVLVFVATKDRAKVLHRELLYDGVRVDSINAAQSHTQRTAAVDNFRAGRTWVLIATDLIGRGMDFVGVRTVINFDFPSSTTDYIHRVGRTGRAAATGEAITFFTEDDAPMLRPVANIIKEAGGQVPGWMLAPQAKQGKAKTVARRKLPPAVASGRTISTQPRPQRGHRSKRTRREAHDPPAGGT